MWDGEEDEDVEQEEELEGKITIIIIITNKLRVAHKSMETIKGWLLVLEIIWGKLWAMKKGTLTSDKKTFTINEKITI